MGQLPRSSVSMGNSWIGLSKYSKGIKIESIPSLPLPQKEDSRIGVFQYPSDKDSRPCVQIAIIWVLGFLGSSEILVFGHGAVSLFFFFWRNTMQFGRKLFVETKSQESPPGARWTAVCPGEYPRTPLPLPRPPRTACALKAPENNFPTGSNRQQDRETVSYNMKKPRECHLSTPGTVS